MKHTWGSLRLRYTEPKEILRELDVDDGVRILVIGDGSSGAYEWAIERGLHVDQHSDVGYGHADIALRDGLIAYYPPQPYAAPQPERCDTVGHERSPAAAAPLDAAELIMRINEFGLHPDLSDAELRNNVPPILEDCRAFIQAVKPSVPSETALTDRQKWQAGIDAAMHYISGSTFSAEPLAVYTVNACLALLRSLKENPLWGPKSAPSAGATSEIALISVIEKLPRIVPSDLGPDEQWRLNSEYVSLYQVKEALRNAAPQAPSSREVVESGRAAEARESAAAAPSATTEFKGNGFALSAERVAINNDLTRWIDKMHDAVLDTDASGRPVGNLFQVWWGLKTEIEKLASSAPSSEARTSGRLSRDSLMDEIVKRDEIIDQLERESATLRLLENVSVLEGAALGTFLRGGDIPNTIEGARVALVKRALQAEGELKALRFSEAEMHLYIACIHHGQRHAVFGVFAAGEEAARKKVIGRNTGWTIDKLVQKDEPSLFRIFDDAWYEAEHGEASALSANAPTSDLVRLLHQRYQDMGDSLTRKAAWRIEELSAALTEIADGKGEFSRDQMEHAKNAIENMKALAQKALRPADSRREEQ